MDRELFLLACHQHVIFHTYSCTCTCMYAAEARLVHEVKSAVNSTQPNSTHQHNATQHIGTTHQTDLTCVDLSCSALPRAAACLLTCSLHSRHAPCPLWLLLHHPTLTIRKNITTPRRQEEDDSCGRASRRSEVRRLRRHVLSGA